MTACLKCDRSDPVMPAVSAPQRAATSSRYAPAERPNKAPAGRGDCRNCGGQVAFLTQQLASVRKSADEAYTRECALGARAGALEEALRRVCERGAPRLTPELRREIDSLLSSGFPIDLVAVEDEGSPSDDLEHMPLERKWSTSSLASTASAASASSSSSASAGSDGDMPAPAASSARGLEAAAETSWDCPLSRAEQRVRLYLLFQDEVKYREKEARRLRSERQRAKARARRAVEAAESAQAVASKAAARSRAVGPRSADPARASEGSGGSMGGWGDVSFGGFGFFGRNVQESPARASRTRAGAADGEEVERLALTDGSSLQQRVLNVVNELCSVSWVGAESEPTLEEP